MVHLAEIPALHPMACRVGTACADLGWHLWTSEGAQGRYLWASRGARAIRVAIETPRLILPHQWGYGSKRGTGEAHRWLPDTQGVAVADLDTPERLWRCLLNIGGTDRAFPIPSPVPVEEYRAGGMVIRFHPWVGCTVEGDTYPARAVLRGLGFVWLAPRWVLYRWPQKADRQAIVGALCPVV